MGFGVKMVNFLVEHKRLTKIGDYQNKVQADPAQCSSPVGKGLLQRVPYAIHPDW